MAWLMILSTIPLAIAVTYTYQYYKNYKAAKSTGFPVKLCIANGLHPIFQIGSVSAREWFVRRPWPLSVFGEWAYYGWTYDDLTTSKTYETIGPVWLMVTAWGNQLILSDPDSAMTVHGKWKQFQKHPSQQALSLFGDNLDTVEGNDWNRHRRLTAPCFNEKCSGLVWSESRRQAAGILKKYTMAGEHGVRSLTNDTQKLALNVLTKIAFGMESDFESGEKIAPGYTMSFQQAIHYIIVHLVPCVALGAKMASPVFPKSWQEIGRGVIEYTKYVQDIVDREKIKLESGITSNNLISVMLRATQGDDTDGKAGNNSLSESEVKGNCFIFTVAGHDTTANSLHLAIAALSSRPQLQEWICEEIDVVLGEEEHPDYEKHFPKLVRCQAVLFETLRLFPAVPEIPKDTREAFLPITVNGKEHMLPPHTHILMNVNAIHRLIKYWGPDSDEWRPQRWIVQADAEDPKNSGTIAKSATTNHKMETIKEPYRGSYMPWAEGPRICPGSRFARVEFVATILTLFRNHRVRPMPLVGESEAQTRQRAKVWAQDAHAKGVAMNLKRPQDVTLIWESRR